MARSGGAGGSAWERAGEGSAALHPGSGKVTFDREGDGIFEFCKKELAGEARGHLSIASARRSDGCKVAEFGVPPRLGERAF